MTDTSESDVLIGVADNVEAAAHTPKVTLTSLCIDSPLYETVIVSHFFLFNLRLKTIQMDAYCIYCGKDSVFRRYTPYSGTQIPVDNSAPRRFDLILSCTRNAEHEYYYVFDSDGNLGITKCGQMPSIADVSGAELRKYAPLLRGGYFEELNRANGLISHGVGIGSFVYLRRIFEKLIQDHRAELEKEGGPIEDFETLRMDEKIAKLKDVLPPALVRNRATYGILSSGIHALSERECKLYFPVVKAAILQILEQDFEARERKKKERELEAEIARVAEALKKGK